MAIEPKVKDGYSEVIDGFDQDVRNLGNVVLDPEFGNSRDHFGGGITMDEYSQIIYGERAKAREWLMDKSWGFRLQVKLEGTWQAVFCRMARFFNQD